MAAPGSFVWGYSPGVLGWSPGRGSGGRPPEAEDINRFWLQKLPEFENFTQFTSGFLTNVFDGGLRGPFRGLRPLVHAWRHHCLSYRKSRSLLLREVSEFWPQAHRSVAAGRGQVGAFVPLAVFCRGAIWDLKTGNIGSMVCHFQVTYSHKHHGVGQTTRRVALRWGARTLDRGGIEPCTAIAFNSYCC